MKREAVIFDLDGTLVHTSPAYIEHIMKKCFAETGIEPTKENIEKIWFGPILEKDRFMLGLGIQPAEFWKKFMDHDSIEERIKYLRAYEDCGALRQLAEKGIRLGLVTNADSYMADQEIGLLRSAGINFDAVIAAFGRDLSIKYRPKPHPDGVLECMRMLGVGSGEALFVGDNPDDAEAARAAGIDFININRGEHFIPVGASISIRSLNELLQLVE